MHTLDLAVLQVAVNRVLLDTLTNLGLGRLAKIP